MSHKVIHKIHKISISNQNNPTQSYQIQSKPAQSYQIKSNPAQFGGNDNPFTDLRRLRGGDVRGNLISAQWYPNITCSGTITSISGGGGR